MNSAETLDFSPLQMEAYLEIAADALSRSIVDPDSKPSIQNFRVDLGRSINPDPLPGKLILGANSHLLNIEDYVVTPAHAEQAVGLRAVPDADQVPLHRRLPGERHGSRLEGLRQHLSRGVRGHARQPRISEGQPVQHRARGPAVAARDTHRRDLPERGHLRAEGEFQDLGAGASRLRTLPRDRHGRQVRRRTSARPRRTGPRSQLPGGPRDSRPRQAANRDDGQGRPLPGRPLRSGATQSAASRRPIATHRGAGRAVAGRQTAGPAAWKATPGTSIPRSEKPCLSTGKETRR